MKNIEDLVHIEFTPDPHVAVDCCQEGNGQRAFYQNEVLAKARVENEGKVPFECPNCRTKYELLKEHVDKAQTRNIPPYAASKNQS